MTLRLVPLSALATNTALESACAGGEVAMSERTFSKISPAIWRSRRFLGLSDRGKVLQLYLLSNAHVSSAGCYELPDGYACADLGWDLSDYLATRSELQDAGMIDVDAELSIILIERWFHHNAPANADHATGCRRRLAAVESERLRDKAIAAFDEVDKQRVEREAAKTAEKAERDAAKAQSVSQMMGNTSRLMSTPLMRGGRK